MTAALEGGEWSAACRGRTLPPGKTRYPLYRRLGGAQGQRVGRGIALLFHDRGTRRGRVVSSTPQPYFTPGKDPVPIVQEAGWAQGPVWTGRKFRPTGIQSPDRPARSQSLYRLSYTAHALNLRRSQMLSSLISIMPETVIRICRVATKNSR